MKESDRKVFKMELDRIGGLPGSISLPLQSDYLNREARENLLEQGFRVYPEREDYSSDIERILRKSDRDLSEAENKRAGGSMLIERKERFWPKRESENVNPKSWSVDIV